MRSNSGGRRTARASSSGKATIAHVGTNAQPTLSQPPQDGLPQDRAQAAQWAGTYGSGQGAPEGSSSSGQTGGAGMRRQRSGSGSAQGQARNRAGRDGDDDGYDYYDDELGEGGSIMGRAANIASSARELLGGWWYGDSGAGQAQGQGQQGQGKSQALQRQLSDQAGQGGGLGGDGNDGGQGQPGQQAGSTRGPWGRHRRGTSLG